MRLQLKLITGCIFALWTSGLMGQPPAPSQDQRPEGLGRFLANLPKPAGPEADEPYAAVPPDFEEAVRLTAMDNFSSATAELIRLLQSADSDDKKVHAHLWLGLNYGSQAIVYPSTGWKYGTSATAHLREAIQMDPQVFLAP